MPGPVEVLLVDDDEDIRLLLRTFLEEDGTVRVAAEAEGAEEALAALAARRYDVVLLDAMMPLVDGFQTARRIRETDGGVPLVLCTAVVDDAVRERARAAGFDDVVDKEEFESLAGRVARAARRTG